VLVDSERAPTPAAALAARARELWVHLAGADFTEDQRVAVSPQSRICPPGWVGVVAIGDDVFATAPDRAAAAVVGRALRGSSGGPPDIGLLASRLPVAEILGPAVLGYLHAADFRPWAADVTIDRLGPDDPDLRQFLRAVDAAGREESGIVEITTPAFAVREQGRVLAAAGYRDWPCDTAHLSVLTTPAARGRGLGSAAASAAVAHAIEEGRLPQWRTRSQASRRIARALGFRELGSQVSVRLANGDHAQAPPASRNGDEPPGADGVLIAAGTATSPRLLLRPWREEDIPAMVAAYRDPVMRRWLRHLVNTADEARDVVEARRADWAAGTCFSFAVLLAEPGMPAELAGSVSIRGLDDSAVAGEVGYWIAAPGRGRGIAARAVDAVCEWAFRLPRRRPLERLELLHSVGNPASCRVAEKSGFSFAAVLPPLLPDFPDDGHLHIRLAPGRD
jgi:RimJ/RimL family protein N-acetyltransferase